MPENKKSKKMSYQQELELIRRKHRGILKPADVVSFAQNPRSALHSHFCWDNTRAAKEYRLHQARMLISITVTIETPEIPQHRVYVSMKADRKRGKAGTHSNGGYRSTAEVLSEAESRLRLLGQMKAELQAFTAGFKRRYGILEELAPVFAAIDAVLANV